MDIEPSVQPHATVEIAAPVASSNRRAQSLPPVRPGRITRRAVVERAQLVEKDPSDDHGRHARRDYRG